MGLSMSRPGSSLSLMRNNTLGKPNAVSHLLTVILQSKYAAARHPMSMRLQASISKHDRKTTECSDEQSKPHTYINEL
jgi:hypothetical protein